LDDRVIDCETDLPIAQSITKSPNHPITRLVRSAVAHFVAATALVAIVGYAGLYGRIGGPVPIQSDGYSYYVYLPSWFIYHDVSLDAVAQAWYGGTYPGFTGINRWPSTERWLNLHPIGTAILTSPFFIAGHLLTRWSNLPPDGFSIYYQHAAGLAGLAYFLAGLALLRRMLRRHFTDGVVLATLVCLTWGTNLFHYGVAEGTFSHAFAFFLVCAWMLAVERWWGEPTTVRSLTLGLVAALIVLTRHPNAIFLLVLPLYGVTKWSDLRARASLIWQRRRRVIVAATAGFAAVLPQLLLYKWITGSWFVSSYSEVGGRFTFASPQVLNVLFSTQKGLFFWSPVLLLAVVGMFVARGWARTMLLSTAIVFAIHIYIVASWFDWQFGGSYGHRAFVDGFGLTAPFFAACFAWAAARPRRLWGVAIFASATVFLSVAQMIQYWMHIIPFSDTTWVQYRALFMRFR
jgi:hypothetical protein